MCEFCSKERALRTVSFVKPNGVEVSFRLGALCIRLTLGD